MDARIVDDEGSGSKVVRLRRGILPSVLRCRAIDGGEDPDAGRRQAGEEMHEGAGAGGGAGRW